MISAATVAPEAPASVQERFRRLVVEWKSQSLHLSNTAQMAMLASYQHMIKIGPAAVPLILEKLARDPDQWFWVLEAITDADPVRPESAGKVREMAQDWLEWGRRHGLDTE